MKIGIAGAGIVGRLLAWHLCQQDCEVHLFCREGIDGKGACSFIAAGMISPYAESDLLSVQWQQVGLQALHWWPALIARLSLPVYYQATGTLVVAQPLHQALLKHFIDKLQQQLTMELPLLSMQEINAHEEALVNLIGCYLPGEARISTEQLFVALTTALSQHGVMWHPHHEVNQLTANAIETNQGCYSFDKTVDARGMGAIKEITHLRAVRGDMIDCQSKDVQFSHMIRFLHPRFPCYIVPREDNRYVIGATEIEDNSTCHTTMRSAMALMSGAIMVHPGFYEANITQIKMGFRPTTADHLPLIAEKEGVIHINGMYRHGFLLAPWLVEQVGRQLMAQA